MKLLDMLLVVLMVAVYVLIFVGIVTLIYSFIHALITKQYKFRMPSFSMILLTILSGILLTLAFTGNESFINHKDCGYPTGAPNCVNLAYGYPRKFISGQSFITLTGKPNHQLEARDINSFSEVSVAWKSLIFDLAFWSGVSFLFISIIYLGVTAAPKNKKTVKRKK